MDALHLVVDWPVRHVAAGVITPDGSFETIGDAERVYHLASITKPLTAWAALVAVEEAVISLEEQPPGVQAGCTYRHLLAHAGGYPFEGREPIAAPARTRIYSNTGVELAVDGITAASRLAFPTYMFEAVLEPLGMTRTELRGSPAHGAHGSCADLLRFAGEVLEPRLIDWRTAADALEVQFPELSGVVPGIGRFDPCPWGLGFEIAGDKHPHWTGTRRSRSTAGHFGGSGTMMWVDPIHRCALVALTDRPFEDWESSALAAWIELSDAIFEELDLTADH